MTSIPNLGDTIAQLRVAFQWSQEALAAETGVSERTIQRIERGDPGAIETIGALARAFGLTIDHLQNLRENTALMSRLEQVPVVASGPALYNLLIGSHARAQQIESEDPSIRAAAVELIAEASDWNDLGLEPRERATAEENLQSALKSLESAGGRLFCVRRPWASAYIGRNGKPIMLDTLYFMVYPAGHPAIRSGPDGKMVLLLLRDEDTPLPS